MRIQKRFDLHMNRQTFHFAAANVRKHFFTLSNIKLAFSTSRTKPAPSEATWRLPSSPIVEKRVVSLCKFAESSSSRRSRSRRGGHEDDDDNGDDEDDDDDEDVDDDVDDDEEWGEKGEGEGWLPQKI